MLARGDFKASRDGAGLESGEANGFVLQRLFCREAKGAIVRGVRDGTRGIHLVRGTELEQFVDANRVRPGSARVVG